ncbi:MAG: hypothetical protein KUG81_10215 [Gammaproteobacteria bacterium]|nr:hypothetical protein [Gammaproteobacteria bacterium]
MTSKIPSLSFDEAKDIIDSSDTVAELVHLYATDRAAFIFDFDKTLHHDADGKHIGWKEQNEPLQELLSDMYEQTDGAVAGISGRPEAFFVSRLPKLFEVGMPIGVEFGALVLQGNNSEVPLRNDISRSVMSEIQNLTQECVDYVNGRLAQDDKVPIEIEGHKKTCRTILYEGIDDQGITEQARDELVTLLRERISDFNTNGQNGGVMFRVQNSKQVDILPLFTGEENIPEIDRDNGKYAATQFIVETVSTFETVKDGEKKLYGFGDSSGDVPMFQAVVDYGGENILVTDSFPEEKLHLVSHHNGTYEDNLSLLKFLVDTPKAELKALVEQSNSNVLRNADDITQEYMDEIILS